MKRHIFGVFVLLFTLAALPAGATHIVGGVVTYKCLARDQVGTSTYQIRIDIYQDCLTGDPNAIAQDNPAIIGIFTGNGNGYMTDSIFAQQPILTIPPNFNNSCVTNPPRTCLRQATFIKTYTLPYSPSGYYVVYQRCCRNGSIINIDNPGAVGATYYCVIPPSTTGGSCNSSAVFNNYPPQIICINNPLFYDHSATDENGDSLSYEFCDAYRGGAANDAKPTPQDINFQPVFYLAPFSGSHPMFGTPALQINPTTGMITGTPTQSGRYVVTVCCHEWRNNVRINTVKREFQFVVTNCSKAVVANIPQYSTEFNTYVVECNSKTVHFKNLSTGGFAYSWDFGVPGTNTDTSSAFEPDFTYPDTGIYIVKLVVNRGSTCPDSISRIVKVYPTFKADFTFSGSQCPGKPIQIIDLTQSTYKPVNYWSWNFGDGVSSTGQNPIHTYDTGNKYQVTLISKNEKGCTDTITKELEIEDFTPFAGNDTTIVKGEHINFQASGGIQYTWTPSTYLENPNIGNPRGYYPDTTTITYVVHIKSIFNCEGNDTITVRVVEQPRIFVPSGFTPNGDGNNETLRPIGVGYRNINYFRVFNRWGELVFYTIRFGDGWNGTLHGKPMDQNTFYWVLSVTDRFGKEEVYKGDATLLR